MSVLIDYLKSKIPQLRTNNPAVADSYSDFTRNMEIAFPDIQPVLGKKNASGGFDLSADTMDVSAQQPYAQTVAFVGDSLTQAGSFAMGGLLASGKTSYITTPALANINSVGTFIAIAQADQACGAGACSLAWAPGGAYGYGKLTFTAPGDTAGAAVDVPGDGFLYVPSGTAGKGINLGIRTKLVDASTLPATAKSDNFTLSGTPTACDHVLDGFSAWADLLTGCPFANVYNFGISGDTPENVLSRIDQVTSVSPQVVVDLSGTNGMALATLERWKAARRAYWNKLFAAGVRTILVGTVFPAGATATTEKRRCIIAFNNWLREQVRTDRRLELWDGYSVLVDVNNATAGEPLAKYFKADMLHLSPAGAYAVAKYALAPKLSKYAGPSVAVSLSPADVYDATYNPAGNIIPGGYGNFVGTAAAGDLAPGTGTLGGGWTNTRSGSTMSCVCTAPSDGSPVARTDRPGEKWQRFSVTGTGATAGDYFQSYLKAPPAPGTSYNIGDTVRFSGVVRISGLANAMGVGIKMNLTGAAVDVEAFRVPGGYALSDLEGDTVLIPFVTPKIAIPAGTTGIKPLVTISSGAGASTAVVDVQDFKIGKA